jgi:hypothetical protein
MSSRRAPRAKFTRREIKEIKTTAKLVLSIVAFAFLAMGCYFWLTGAMTGSPAKPVPSAPDTVLEVSAPKQTDGDAAWDARARAQQWCDEGNQDACTLLQNMVSDPPAAAGTKP